MRRLSCDPADELPATDMATEGAGFTGDRKTIFRHATDYNIKYMYCNGQIDGLNSPSRSARRRHYQI